MRTKTPSEAAALVDARGIEPGPVDEADAGADSGSRARRRRGEATPAQRALALLVRREHSRPELQRKLIARGVSDDAAEAAVATMVEAGWQDDARFAASLARARVMAGYGPIRIEAELGTHGLGADVVAGALQSIEEDGDADWPARALDLLERRFDAGVLAGDVASRRKAGDFLIRRGFGAEVMRNAIRRFCGR
ncbi:regulatory protein RecX [Luteimonas deserti]|uniref:Regulatory protein RecX n=1 Tax=Luteimonas deserti TaxID=2752306 RepID=A0A7Z0QS03_9GAMM|nr:regulatory protein RecX [Luteimonas deserti]NYZ63789.1 regulatory protein RecX [Luteimonas deserti]